MTSWLCSSIKARNLVVLRKLQQLRLKNLRSVVLGLDDYFEYVVIYQHCHAPFDQELTH